MATSLKDLIPYFLGQDINKKRGQEDPVEYMDNWKFMVDSQIYTNKDEKLTTTCDINWTHLYDKALFWYYNLSLETQKSW